LTWVCYSSLNTSWRCTIKRKILLSFLSFTLILALIFPTACVAKRPSTSPASSGTDADRITALESKVGQLQSKIASLPTSSGNYDGDIEALRADIDSLYTNLDDLHTELYDILDEVDTMLADWEEVQTTNTNTDTDAIGTTTRWSLDAWTDYDSFKLLDIDLDSKKIEDEDDYTIWLLLYNDSHATINESSTTNNLETKRASSLLIKDYLYFETDGLRRLLKATSLDAWIPVDFASIYQSVEVKEITIQFSPKSSDRIIVDESQTELYSTGYPSFDWGMDFSNRINGTCKRIEATTETRFTIPVPTRFFNNDPEKPCPEEFKLEFELAYKQ